jgi:hypothetical protein
MMGQLIRNRDYRLAKARRLGQRDDIDGMERWWWNDHAFRPKERTRYLLHLLWEKWREGNKHATK